MALNKLNKKALATDGIIVINKEQVIIVFNEAASRITGFNEQEVL
ncbi:MAG: PAS domain-containing protein, partial [Ignavibacteriae bacterium]|nr:PAS domain-containing protein [Ignavibacteriota bacterium]